MTDATTKPLTGRQVLSEWLDCKRELAISLDEIGNQDFCVARGELLLRILGGIGCKLSDKAKDLVDRDGGLVEMAYIFDATVTHELHERIEAIVAHPRRVELAKAHELLTNTLNDFADADMTVDQGLADLIDFVQDNRTVDVLHTTRPYNLLTADLQKPSL